MDEEKQELREESRGLTFKDILFILRKNWIAIVIFIVAGFAGGLVYTKVSSTVNPVYQASGVIMVSPEGNTSSQTAAQDYTLSNNLTNTVVSFVKTNSVLKHVLEENPKFKASNLSVSNTTGNLMIRVKYSSKDKQEAVDMVNLVMDWTCKEADSSKPDDESAPKYHMLKNNLNIVDRAEVANQVSHTMRDVALGTAAGIGLAFLFVVIKELSDNTFKSSEEIERMLGIPVLAGIPDYHFDDEKKGGK